MSSVRREKSGELFQMSRTFMANMVVIRRPASSKFFVDRFGIMKAPYSCQPTVTLGAARLAAIGAREPEHRVHGRARSRSEPRGPRRPSDPPWRTIRTIAAGWGPHVGRGKAATSRPPVNALAPQHAGHTDGRPPHSSSPLDGS